MKRYLVVFALSFFAVATFGQKENTLTAQEKKDGWKLLFDGTSTKGWRNFNSDKINPGWKVANGSLYLDTTKVNGKRLPAGDIVTVGEYENYELSIDWKIQACGNSGIIFNVQEGKAYTASYQTGPEMQVLDNACHPDAKISKHRAGDLYDLISCSTETVKPAGEWNQAKLIANKGHYTFWLNGIKTVEFEMGTPAWSEMVAGSKFKTMPDFGKFTKGRIDLQDHGDMVSYRNIKIKELK
ncbi:MAG: DUF1080 domain-containing protein [Cyclobacteriaceae bacterium]|nr:DUF1080 domain-containing protein [Cyclobacteriaceae bacterium]